VHLAANWIGQLLAGALVHCLRTERTVTFAGTIPHLAIIVFARYRILGTLAANWIGQLFVCTFVLSPHAERAVTFRGAFPHLTIWVNASDTIWVHCRQWCNGALVLSLLAESTKRAIGTQPCLAIRVSANDRLVILRTGWRKQLMCTVSTETWWVAATAIKIFVQSATSRLKTTRANPLVTARETLVVTTINFINITHSLHTHGFLQALNTDIAVVILVVRDTDKMWISRIAMGVLTNCADNKRNNQKKERTQQSE